MKINCLLNLLNFVSYAQDYLLHHGIIFSDSGLPLLNKNYFLNDYPDIIVPIQHWKNKKILDKKKHVCVSFVLIFIFIEELGKYLMK